MRAHWEGFLLALAMLTPELRSQILLSWVPHTQSTCAFIETPKHSQSPISTCASSRGDKLRNCQHHTATQTGQHSTLGNTVRIVQQIRNPKRNHCMFLLAPPKQTMQQCNKNKSLGDRFQPCIFDPVPGQAEASNARLLKGVDGGSCRNAELSLLNA